MTWTPEQLLARAGYIDRMIDLWKGNEAYADQMRMEAWALRTAAAIAGSDPFGYLLEQEAAPNGYVFITTAQYATIKDEFQHLYRPIYAGS